MSGWSGGGGFSEVKTISGWSGGGGFSEVTILDSALSLLLSLMANSLKIGLKLRQNEKHYL